MSVFFVLYGVYLIPLSWVIWWFVSGQKQRLNLLSSLFAGILAWQGINRLLKLFYFQSRPTANLPVTEFLFERPENSFPSDHGAFLFGIAFFFLLTRYPKIGRWLLALALLVSFSRVAVGVHYASDIFASAISGLLAAWLAKHLHEFLSTTVWAFLLNIARKLRLA